MKNLAKLFGALAYALFTFERFADRNEPIRSEGRYVVRKNLQSGGTQAL
jgi:hypothetical protein